MKSIAFKTIYTEDFKSIHDLMVSSDEASVFIISLNRKKVEAIAVFPHDIATWNGGLNTLKIKPNDEIELKLVGINGRVLLKYKI